jgi:hypothetical protein
LLSVFCGSYLRTKFDTISDFDGYGSNFIGYGVTNSNFIGYGVTDSIFSYAIIIDSVFYGYAD